MLEAAFARPLSDPRRFQVIRSQLLELARSDPRAALQWSHRIHSLRESHRARNQILARWAAADPMAALTWANTASVDLPRNLYKEQMQAIVTGFAKHDPAGAFQYVSGLDEGSDRALRFKSRLLNEVIETQIRAGGVEQARATILQMGDGPLKSSLQRELVKEWAGFDPQSAAAYVRLQGPAASDLTTSLITAWAVHDPAAAADWLQAVSPEDPALEQASTIITREWARYDLAASSAWLNSLPASPHLDHAVATYTARAAHEAPATAMSWAESINHGQLRTNMMQQVATRWQRDDPATFQAYLHQREFSDKQRRLLEAAAARPPKPLP